MQTSLYAYEQLLTCWDTNVSLFFEWLINICGVSNNNATYLELLNYVKDVNDINDWVDFFDGNFDNVIEASQNYIEWRKLNDD